MLFSQSLILLHEGRLAKASVSSESSNQEQNSSIMHNGNNGPGRNIREDESYDIGPDETRLPLFTQENNGQPLIPIQMISGTRETADGGMELEYEQVYVQRPRYGIFYEPQDETPPERFHSRREDYYYREKNRLSTFLDTWLDEYPVSPEELARNGFIFVGPADRVKCIFCLNYLRGWDVGDTVEGEHRRHFPDCPFVSGQANHLNIPLPGSKSQLMGIKVKNPNLSKNQDMSNTVNRLETYHNAPPLIQSKKGRFTDAGFFYTGQRDCLECFSCGQRLSNWEPTDDAFTEHAKLSPSCHYIHKVATAQNNIEREELKPSNPNLPSAPFNNEKNPSLVQNAHGGLFETDLKLNKDYNSHSTWSMDKKPQWNTSQKSTVSSAQKNLGATSQQNVAPLIENVPGIQAFMQLNNIDDVEEVRRLFEKIKIDKGLHHNVTVEDLEDYLTELKMT